MQKQLPVLSFDQHLLGTISLLNWAKQVEAMSDETVPLVHSVSYGNDEAQQTGVPHMDSCNTEFQKIGVRGISILFASGDQGVLEEKARCALSSRFPRGKSIYHNGRWFDFATMSTIGDEKAWVDGGGGFSNTFGILLIKDVVENYIKTAQGLPKQTYWNATGRGYRYRCNCWSTKSIALVLVAFYKVLLVLVLHRQQLLQSLHC